MCQRFIEAERDKRRGEDLPPPGGKNITVFMDDLYIPEKQQDNDGGQVSIYYMQPSANLERGKG